MRKLILTSLCCLGLLPVLGVAQVSDPLRTVSSISIVDGKVGSTGVLADSSGTVFVELTKDSFVGSELDQREFNGEILAPYIINNVVKKPRGRMREIVSFDLFTDRADTAIFVDRYAMMHERTRLREQILTGTDFTRTSGGQVLLRLNRNDNIGQAALWRYDNLTEEWSRVGGTTSNSSEPDIDVFAALIFQTGTYTIWDEDPAPEFSTLTDPGQVELVETSPFPSVIASDAEVSFLENTVDGFENPFIDEGDFITDQTVPAIPISSNLDEPIGLIPAVGLSPSAEAPEPTEVVGPGNFSEEFLGAIEPALSSAPEIEPITAPAGATLPSTGGDTETTNWLNYMMFFLVLGIIGGSIYIVRSRPY